MLGRSTPLSCLARLLGLMMLLLTADDVQAHRLVASYDVLPDHKVQVSCRYKAIPRSFPAQDARVRVFRPDGQLLSEGQTDEKGQFLFSYEKVEPLRVEVYQEGHRDEVRIEAADLGQASATETNGQPNKRQDSSSATGDNLREWVKEVLVGVGFLLALAAFVLSLRNARHLRTLKAQSPSFRGEPTASASATHSPEARG